MIAVAVKKKNALDHPTALPLSCNYSKYSSEKSILKRFIFIVIQEKSSKDSL